VTDLKETISGESGKKEEMCNLVRRAWHRGLMFSSCGSVSARLGDNDFLITTEDSSMWDLSENDIVRVCKDRHETGKIPDRYARLHQDIYLKHHFINSIILAQPSYLMAFGVTNREIDIRTIPESWIFLQDIPSVPFGAQLRGHNEIPDLLSRNTPVIMIRNDSVLVTGESLLQAFDRLEIAELSAMSLILSRPLGMVFSMDDNQIAELRKVFMRS
jgi:L-fuculose-phosphate aldolase